MRSIGSAILAQCPSCRPGHNCDNMVLPGIIAACALAALLFLCMAVRAFGRVRLVAGSAHFLLSACFALAALAAGLLGTTLLSYQRLTHEQLAMELQFEQLGERHYRVKATYPSGRRQAFELRGDEWQVDARVLKWRGLATVLGFDSVYRLERISGRYRDLAAERTAERTVHALHEPADIDVWDLLRRAKAWAPWIDALHGSATYLPMSDGASYQVTASQSGLVARPLNQAAREAVGGWR